MRRAITTTAVRAIMAICSQKPARVSTILRSSTVRRRPIPGRGGGAGGGPPRGGRRGGGGGGGGGGVRAGGGGEVGGAGAGAPGGAAGGGWVDDEGSPRPAVGWAKQGRPRLAARAGAGRRSGNSLAIAKRPTPS